VKIVDSGSDFGKIPEGWKISTVGNVCNSLIDGDWVESKDQGGNDYRLLQVSNIGIGSFIETGNLRFISQGAFDRLRCTQILPNDVLIARMPKPTGRAWLVTEMPWKMVTAVDVAIGRVNDSILRSIYFVEFLNSEYCLDLVAKRATGTTRPRITRRDLTSLPILIPPLELQDMWTQLAEHAYALKVNLQFQTSKLSRSRDLLVPKLVTGEIQV
jgi:type I restriction enzyme S subunit